MEGNRSAAGVQCNRTTTDTQIYLYSIAIPIISGVCLLAFVLNLFILVLVRGIRGPLTTTLLLTLSLAFSDMWTSIVVATSLVLNSYLPIVMQIWVCNQCYGLILEAVRMGGMLTGTTHLLILAINHYLSIAKPFIYSKLLNRRNTILIILLTWSLPSVIFLVYFSLIPNQAFQSHKCSNMLFAVTLTFRLTVSLVIFTPMLVTSLLYVHVIVILRKMTKKFARKPLTQLANQSANQSNNQANQATAAGQSMSAATRGRISRERRMLVTTLLIWLTFLIGWGPAAIHFLLSCSTCILSNIRTKGANRERDLFPIFLASFIQLSLIMCKSVVNPIIYAVRIPEIQHQMHALLNRIKCCACTKTEMHKGTNNDQGVENCQIAKLQKMTPSNGHRNVNFEEAEEDSQLINEEDYEEEEDHQTTVQL